MRTLIVNAGSSSLKWSLFEDQLRIDSRNIPLHRADSEAFASVIQELQTHIGHADIVAHRIVHGGPHLTTHSLINDTVLHAIEEASNIAPLHNLPAVRCLHTARKVFSEAKHVAAFDTAFHRSMPKAAKSFALDQDVVTRFSFERFGFHGLSCEHAIRRLKELQARQTARTIICHLGSGCSLTAVCHGQSVDTTMGFSPLDGVMMSSRAGSIDPGVLLHLMANGYTYEQLSHMLHKKSGWSAISGLGISFEKLEKSAKDGNENAQLAAEMFVRSVQKNLAAMVVSLGGLDTIVFTGGVGEHSAWARERIVRGLSFFNVQLNTEKNEKGEKKEKTGIDRAIHTNESAVELWVIEAQEDLMMLRHALELL